MTINEIQDEIIKEFSAYDDWIDKYSFLIKTGKNIPIIDKEQKTGKNSINGCQSKVWLHASMENGLIKFTADSDAMIVKGITSLLVRVLSDKTPEEIMNSDLYFIDKIGLKQNLSPTRSNGLLAMLKQMKLYAIAYNTELKNKRK